MKKKILGVSFIHDSSPNVSHTYIGTEHNTILDIKILKRRYKLAWLYIFNKEIILSGSSNVS